jgi:uncharacterized protein YlxW (UPF0749 family)
MDLLTQVIAQAREPEYVAARSRPPEQGGKPPRRSRGNRIAFLCSVLVIAALFTIAGAQTTRERTAIETEREQLITRIERAEAERDRLLAQVDRLAAENARLRTEGLGDDGEDQALRDRLRETEAMVGVSRVSGPGITVIADDAPAGGGQVIDVDLQILVNGLWAAGAEAIQINGHRVTNLTAIRHAGEAITVNYRSLNPPYRIDAIGDQRTLQPRLLESWAGTWWNSLKQNQGLRYEVRDVDQLSVAGIPGLAVRTASKHRS